MENKIYDNINSRLLSLYEMQKCILDIGCGTGALGGAIKVLNPNARVYGVDISSESVSIAKNILDRACVVDLDFERIPFNDTKFDLIILGDVLEHLKWPSKLLEEVKSLLSEDGVILVSIPNVAHWSVRFQLLKGHFDYDYSGIMDDTHLRFFTDNSFRKMLLSIKYKVVMSDFIKDNINPNNIGLKIFLFYLRIRKKYRWLAYQFVYKIKVDA